MQEVQTQLQVDSVAYLHTQDGEALVQMEVAGVENVLSASDRAGTVKKVRPTTEVQPVAVGSPVERTIRGPVASLYGHAQQVAAMHEIGLVDVDEPSLLRRTCVQGKCSLSFGHESPMPRDCEALPVILQSCDKRWKSIHV